MPDEIIIEDDNAPDTKVKASFTEGYGLFAARDFSRGETIVDYNLFPDSWYETRYNQLNTEQIRRNWYIMIDSDRCTTSDRWSKFSYINHSRKPNCLWKVEEKLILADLNITEGDELFIDYRLRPRLNRAEYSKWI